MSVVLSQLLHCDNVLPAFLLLPEPNCEQSERDRWFSAQRNSALCSQTSTKGAGRTQDEPMGPQTRTPNNCKGNRVSAGSLGCWMQGLEERKPNSRSLPSAPSYPEMGIATSLLHSVLS